MKNLNNTVLLIAAVALLILCLFSCKKDHAEIRLTPAFKVGDKVQFLAANEHDHYSNGILHLDTPSGQWIATTKCCLVNIPQPLTILSFEYRDAWNDNWYYVVDAAGNKRHDAIDQLSLQLWTGTLQK